MTMQQKLAETLNGMEYRSKIADADLAAAKENGLVIVTGASDDLVEFEGAIYDEVGAYNGTEIALDAGGIIESCDEACDHCEQANKIATASQSIKAQWNAEGYSWHIVAEGIPNAAYFDVLEDGDKYCRGVVFALSDLK